MNTFKSLRNGAIATLLTMTCALSAASLVQAATDSSTVQVTVNASAPVEVVPATALGVNTAAWDPNFSDSSLPALLQNIHVSMLRYPGGSTSDVYHWETNSVDGGGGTNPNDGFDSFMSMANAAGAQPIITVNAGDGQTDGSGATEAADWVKYANVTHQYNVEYWEIGNEMYGSWENGNFAGNPAGYANEVSQYIKAMKAVDPSIKIGVDLIAPGTGEDDWNSTVISTLQQNGTLPDFGIVHWYAQNAGGETDAGLLSSTDQIPTMMDTLKQQLGNIPVFVTETNSVNTNPGKQSTSLVNALFLDDDIADWLQAGAANVDWWDLYNGIVTGSNDSPSLYGSTDYGDYGLLSTGSSANGESEPPLDTPFPSYYGYQMLGAVVQPGSTLVGAGSSNNLVAAHASKLPNGDLAVMLINKDPNNTYDVNLNLEGYLAKTSATELSYGEGSQSVSQSQVQYNGSVQISPYSVTDLILQPQNGHQPQGPQASDSTTVSGATVKPSYTESITSTFTDTRAELKDATLDLEIYNPSGQIVGQQTVPDVTLEPGQSSDPVTLSDWSVPNVPGTYTVKAFVFSNGGANTVLADQNAATFTVTQPDPVVQNDVTVTTSLSASSVSVGTPVTITTTYTNTSKTDWLTNGILDQYVYLNGNFSTQFTPNATLAPGQSVTETATFTPTSAGTYTFPVGLFTSTWSLIQWYQGPNTPTLTVTD
ncbi:hypothetical protein [Alicyclobacillus acidiphilus]|uniref:hypothetical protein n=1 Tax=Alicyclobacillus acidiphilus TaxID=182455 RepID=UPI0008310CB1|nr:hypothetical protein [Alicyclobacillus acidiphilus]